ncbi:putative nitrate/sulfonate/taurine/bicarbonate ABC superfamily ATP binding cassette transporter [Clostridioides difficile DA00165]|nr:putative nitrate/sulfonate/taurine/bicarbonate ABC superfamily ATP binding cassette transporter [Clostridioides difficile DA00165]
MFKKIVAIASSIIVSTICLTGCDFNSNDKKDESSSSKNLDKVTIAEVTHSVFMLHSMLLLRKDSLKMKV